MVWGNNIVISNPDEYKGEHFSVALNRGAKLIAVDPETHPHRSACRCVAAVATRDRCGSRPWTAQRDCERRTL